MTAHTHAQATSETATLAARTLQRACACGESAGVAGKCPTCDADERLGAQPKLRVNRPGDRWEQEADRIADEVASSRPAPASGPLSVTPLIQRQAAEDEREDEGELQAKPAPGGSVAHQPSAADIGAVAVGQGGRPLAPAQRSFFEPCLGRDLSSVRIHDDARAGAAARGIGARAYTLGPHIAFAPGQFAPDTPEGRRLIAHELTHTIQQGTATGPIQRAESGGTFGGFLSNTFRFIASIFGQRPDYDDEDLEAYLDQISELGGPAGDFDSDNKALAIAGRIEAGESLFGHEDTVELRKILIREMQAGATLGDEEQAILYLMTSLYALQVMQLFEGPNALVPEELRSDIDGENRERLDKFLNNMGIEAEGLEPGENYEGCDEEELGAIEDAVRLSQADITEAIDVLDGAPDADPVRHSFFLAFRVRDPSDEQISEMVGKLRAVRAGAGNVDYVCDHGSQQGDERSQCDNGTGGYTSVDPTRESVHICFMSDGGTDTENLAEEENEATRSNLITHEAAHFYLGVDDRGYFSDQCHETEKARSCLNGTKEDCGTSGRSPEERFDNADSYACFVFYLARLADVEAEEEGEDTLESRAEAYRGGDLELEIRYPMSILDVALFNKIYLAEDEKTEYFIVTGEPPASGFEHEFWLEADGQRLSLEEEGFRGKSAAYVPDETKGRLRDLHANGTTDAEVVVETTIYSEAPEGTNVETRLRVRLTTDEADFGL